MNVNTNMNTRYGSAIGLIKGNQIYLSRRSDKVLYGKKWQFVNGRLCGIETGKLCAVRLIKEQTGIEISENRLYYVKYELIEEVNEYYYIYLVHLKNEEMPKIKEEVYYSPWRLFDLRAASVLDLVPGIRPIIRSLRKNLMIYESEKTVEETQQNFIEYLS